MIKTVPTALATIYASGAPTIAYTLKITRGDGQVFAFTSGVDDVVFSGTTYLASQGLDVSAIATSSGLNVDTLELTTTDDGTLFNAADVRARIWQNAAFVISRYNWASPADGTEALLAGTFGNVTMKAGAVTIELRGLQQYLQQSLGNVTSKTCRARFADMPTQNGSNRCGLVAATWTDSLTVSAVTDRRSFTASGSTRGADWFAEGLITWTSGANVGQVCKVKAYSAAKLFELLTPMQRDIAIGDTFTALAGCRKRLVEDCSARFANTANFQGEPHMPGVDALTATPDVSV